MSDARRGFFTDKMVRAIRRSRRLMANLPPRTVAVIGAVCLTVGWLLASMLTPPVARLQTLPERRPRTTPAPPPDAGFTEHLHFRLRQAPEPPIPRRNPFRFAQRSRAGEAPITTSAAAARDTSAVAPVAPVAVGPAFSLSGIAVAGDVRTAILAEGQRVHLVKIGDRLAGYEVMEVTDDSVTLREASGATHLLRLR
jgi:hypothetical protein